MYQDILSSQSNLRILRQLPHLPLALGLIQLPSIFPVLNDNTLGCLYEEDDIDCDQNKQRPVIVNRARPSVSFIKTVINLNRNIKMIGVLLIQQKRFIKFGAALEFTKAGVHNPIVSAEIVIVNRIEVPLQTKILYSTNLFSIATPIF